MGIRTKITAGMLVAALLPLLLFWGINYSASRARVSSEVEARLSSVVVRQVSHVQDWMDGTLRGMKLAASNPALADLDPLAAKSSAQRLVQNYPWLVASFVVDKEGQQIARNNDEKLSNIGDRSYFVSALAGEVTTLVAISKANGQPVLLSAAPITSRAGVVGAVGISAELTTISDLIVSEKLGDSGFSFLVDEKGKLVAHPDKVKVAAAAEGKGEEFARHPAIVALSGSAPSFVSFEQGGKRWVSSAAKTPSGWIVVAQIEESEAFAPLDAVNFNAILTLLGTVLFVLVIALVLGKRLSSPIVFLTGVADDISKGKFDDQALDHIPPGDEIGDLAAAVKRLSASVKLAMEMLRTP